MQFPTDKVHVGWYDGQSIAPHTVVGKIIGNEETEHGATILTIEIDEADVTAAEENLGTIRRIRDVIGNESI